MANAKPRPNATLPQPDSEPLSPTAGTDEAVKLPGVPAWDGNGTSDAFLAWSWHTRDGQRLLVAVNYAGHQSQCYIRALFSESAGRTVQLKDLMGAASYDRDGGELGTRGLYLDLPPRGYHVFEVSIV